MGKAKAPGTNGKYGLVSVRAGKVLPKRGDRMQQGLFSGPSVDKIGGVLVWLGGIGG